MVDINSKMEDHSERIPVIVNLSDPSTSKTWSGFTRFLNSSDFLLREKDLEASQIKDRLPKFFTTVSIAVLLLIVYIICLATDKYEIPIGSQLIVVGIIIGCVSAHWLLNVLLTLKERKTALNWWNTYGLALEPVKDPRYWEITKRHTDEKLFWNSIEKLENLSNRLPLNKESDNIMSEALIVLRQWNKLPAYHNQGREATLSKLNHPKVRQLAQDYKKLLKENQVYEKQLNEVIERGEEWITNFQKLEKEKSLIQAAEKEYRDTRL